MRLLRCDTCKTVEGAGDAIETWLVVGLVGIHEAGNRHYCCVKCALVGLENPDTLTRIKRGFN